VTPAFSYFARVFAIGFLFGAVRTMFVVPRLGVRLAELLELPLMLLAVFAVAGWLRRRYPELDDRAAALRTGLAALVMLLIAEVALGLAARGGSVRDVLFDRDPVSGTAYYASLCLFALMPWLRARGRRTGVADR
jgi:uncharacterized membrane protein YeiH